MSAEDLDREVERMRNRPAPAPKAPRETALPVGVLGLADVMPEVMATFERMGEDAKAFAASIRPKFDAAPQTHPCGEHPQSQRQADFDATVRESRRQGFFVMTYGPCAECARGSQEVRQRAFWAKRGVPERVLDATSKNFVADTDQKREAVAAVRGWVKGSKLFLLLFGKPGTGKGHLAAAALKANGTGLFITHADMMMDLRASYVTHDTKALIERWQDVGMLVVDEFGGPGTAGADAEGLLYSVFAHRYENRLRTIITTNLPLPELRTLLGDRLLDRVTPECVSVPMIWESWRANK